MPTFKKMLLLLALTGALGAISTATGYAMTEDAPISDERCAEIRQKVWPHLKSVEDWGVFASKSLGQVCQEFCASLQTDALAADELEKALTRSALVLENLVVPACKELNIDWDRISAESIRQVFGCVRAKKEYFDEEGRYKGPLRAEIRRPGDCRQSANMSEYLSLAQARRELRMIQQPVEQLPALIREDRGENVQQLESHLLRAKQELENIDRRNRKQFLSLPQVAIVMQRLYHHPDERDA